MAGESRTSFAILSKRIVTPGGIVDGAVVIDAGVIRRIVRRGDLTPEIRTEDAGSLIVMPGLVDTHVHINEPGRTEWEGFDTATKAAAAGGVTMLVDMPLNNSPVTTTPAAFEKKLGCARGGLRVDCGFYGGLVQDNAREIPGMIASGVLGIKAFLIHSGLDEFPRATEKDLREAMPAIAKAGIPLLVHCELQSPHLQTQPHLSPRPRSYNQFLSSRPDSWELEAIDLMIRLCREYRCRTHVVHLSSADALPMIRDARRSGLPLTVETCPHYLYFCAEEIPDGDTRFKCTPPIRGRENRDRLWKALGEGDIDFIASDHSPTIPALKELESGSFEKAWGGIASLQFGLSVVWTEARKRNVGISDVVRWMSERTAEFIGFGMKKGKIEKGFDADLVVWDPDESFTVTPSTTLHRHPVTPYQGRTLRGKIRQTYLRGAKIFDGERVLGDASGECILAKASEG